MSRQSLSAVSFPQTLLLHAGAAPVLTQALTHLRSMAPAHHGTPLKHTHQATHTHTTTLHCTTNTLTPPHHSKVVF